MYWRRFGPIFVIQTRTAAVNFAKYMTLAHRTGAARSKIKMEFLK